MDDNKETGATTETVDNANTETSKEETQKEEKLYTRVQLEAIKKAEREAWEKEREQEKLEADKLANMKAEEKTQYRIQKETERADKAERNYNALQVQIAATEYATKVGLPISFLPKSYADETTDTITKRIDDMYTDYSKALEEEKNKKLRQDPPKTVVSGSETVEKTVPQIF